MRSNTRKTIILLSVFALSTVLMGETNIPPGTMIPVVLNHALDMKKTKPGQIVTADIMQEVPLDNGAKIRAGTRVIGEVVAITPASASSPATITLRFDRIKTRGQFTAIRTDLRALAAPIGCEATPSGPTRETIDFPPGSGPPYRLVMMWCTAAGAPSQAA